jgi:outer membrane protein assembly factor BamA
MHGFQSLAIFTALCLCGTSAWSQTTPANLHGGTSADSTGASVTKSKFRSAEDGWFDLSGFLDQRFGFLPLIIPITEPAVGYGAGFGLAFIDKPLVGSNAGFGRPNITLVGGLWTENGTWGAVAGDSRYWLGDRLQTLAGVFYASVNLDFYGIGDDPALHQRPLRYNLEPKGGMLRGKYRLCGSRVWAGVSYAYATTQVSFDAPAGTPRIPDYQRDSNVGGVTPSLFYDSRDNVFTPLRGTYVEATAGLFSEALGGDDDFQRVQLVLLEYIPIRPRVGLGLRGDGAASFGEAPFYLLPYISLRGAAMMRYQGEQVAQAETELRWQFWKRFSLLGFAGCGAAWNEFEHLENLQSIVTGGAGFRYELAREYGIHAGVDLGFGPDETAIYIQVGSAWARP